MTTEAERLADTIDAEFVTGRISNYNGLKAAVELRRLASIEAERNAFKRDLDAELAGNAELRSKLGARDNETMWQFADRLAAEVEALRVDAERYRKIAWLIGSIFVHGDFKAETFNERELEKLLRDVGCFWDSLSDFDAAMKEQPNG